MSHTLRPIEYGPGEEYTPEKPGLAGALLVVAGLLALALLLGKK